MGRTARVAFVARWDGWCTPCQSEDRPLVLTRTGGPSLRSWWAGDDADDSSLLLTCRVCGDWQVVPLLEQDDPEVVLPADDAPAERPLSLVTAPAAPAPRAPALRLVHRPAVGVTDLVPAQPDGIDDALEGLRVLHG